MGRGTVWRYTPSLASKCISHVAPAPSSSWVRKDSTDDDPMALKTCRKGGAPLNMRWTEQESNTISCIFQFLGSLTMRQRYHLPCSIDTSGLVKPFTSMIVEAASPSPLTCHSASLKSACKVPRVDRSMTVHIITSSSMARISSGTLDMVC